MSPVACEGWWEQRGLGRQPMAQLHLSFDEGNVHGSGTDIIGLFTFTGRLDCGKVVLVKQYMGKHRVDYIGDFDGEGTFHGTWRVGLYGFLELWMIKIVSVLEEPDIRQIGESTGSP